MTGRDPHSALKSDVIAKSSRDGREAVVARLQWGKGDVGYSLHVNPSSHSLSGLQPTDVLGYLGFERSDQCSFTQFRRCYVKWVAEGFDPDAFLNAFGKALPLVQHAQQGLEACGFRLPQPEGWSYFHGTNRRPSHPGPRRLSGDGHTARQIRPMKKTEDHSFLFHFTFIETDREKGFVTHYRPKHYPVSSEISSVLAFLGLHQFAECPEFDFEPCFYRTLEFEERGDGPFDSNTEYAHRTFDAHAMRFSSAIRDLLSANEEIEAIGMQFLPFAPRDERLTTDIKQNIILPPSPAANTVSRVISSKDGVPANFDVAISVAGSDREYAAKLADQIRAAGYAVFYYESYPEYLWGKNLTVTFDEIFRKRSRYCVIFVSRDYRDRVWTSHELRSAQARAVEEKGNEYILPIRIDDTELDALLPTVGYVPISMGIDKISDLLISKLRS